MNNKGFEVKLNDELLCRAGIKDNHGIVSCIIDALYRDRDKEQGININIGGLNTDSDQSVNWFRSNQLKENDTISIKIISGYFDEPNEKSEKPSEQFLLEQKIKAYYRLQKELKDHL